MKTKYGIRYEKLFKKYTLGILYLILASYLFGGFLYYLTPPLSYVFLAGCILNIIPIFLVHNIPVLYTIKLVKVCFSVIIIPMYIITILCLLKGVVTPLFWYMVVPVYLYTTFPSKRIVKWSIAILCLMLSSFGITFILQYTIFDNALVKFEPMQLHQMLLTEIVNAFFFW